MSYYPGKNLPQPYVRNIELEETGNDLFATIDVSFKRTGMLNQSRRRDGGKGHNPAIHVASGLQNVKIAIIRISDESLLKTFNSHSRLQKQLVDIFSRAKSNKSATSNRPLPFEARRIGFNSTNQAFADKGDTVVFTEKFTIDKRAQHLSFCVFTYYDNENNDYSDIPTNILNSFISYTSEEVIRNGAPVVNGTYFAPAADTKAEKYFINTSAGTVWTGPTHTMPNGTVMAGATHSSGGAHLTPIGIFNTKLRDYRTLDLVEKIFTPAGNNSTVGFDIGPVTKTAKISDLLITKDANGTNLLFDLNWFELIKQQAKYPTLLKTSNIVVFTEILNSCRIETITLKRIKKQTLQSDDDLEEIVAVTQRESGEKMSGGIQEISKDIFTGAPLKGAIKTYTASDTLIPKASPGRWQYKVEIEWTDGTELYVKNLFKALSTSFENLQRYSREIERHKRSSDPRDLDLLKNINFSTVPHQNNTGPWQLIVINLFKLMSFFRPARFKSEQMTALQLSIIYMLHPRTASLKSVGLATDMVRNIIINIENKFNIASLSTAQKGSLNSSSAAGTGNTVRSSRNLFTHTFRNAVNAKELNGCNWDYGWNYIPTTTSVGLNKTSEIVFKRRVVEETNRFFTTDSIDEFDLNKQALSFLAPSKLNARSKTFKTYSSDPKEIISETDVIMNIINCADGAAPPSKVDCPAEPTKSFNDNPCPDRTENLSREAKINLLRMISYGSKVDKIKFDILHPESVNFEQDPLSGLSLEEQQRFNKELESDEPSRCVEGDFLNEIDPSSFIKSLIMTRDFGFTKEAICSIENLEQFATVPGRMPNQIKSMLVADSSLVVDNLFNEDGRFTMSPAAFWVKYGNIVRIEAQISFGGPGSMSVKERNWLPLTQALITTAINGGKNLLLCRMTTQPTGIPFWPGQLRQGAVPVYDEYFLLNFPRPTRSTTGPQNQAIDMDITSRKELYIPNELIHTTGTYNLTSTAKTTATTSTSALRGDGMGGSY